MSSHWTGIRCWFLQRCLSFYLWWCKGEEGWGCRMFNAVVKILWVIILYFFVFHCFLLFEFNSLFLPGLILLFYYSKRHWISWHQRNIDMPMSYISVPFLLLVGELKCYLSWPVPFETLLFFIYCFAFF